MDVIQVVERSSKCDACKLKGTCSDQKSENQCAEERMSNVLHKILIGSGKGGVGKSTVTVNLAKALSQKGYSVGIIDADITGPNIPKLLGIEDQRLRQGTEGIEPGNAKGIKVVSMALLLSSRESAVVWRGPMKMGAIKQFISDVNWGSLDYLLIDLPPGTSDEPLSVVQLIPDMTGAIIVTTPQEVSLLDSRKAINMIKSMKVPVLGLIENMSGLCCPHCGKTVNIFSTGGGQRAAGEMDVPFLGSIPLDPEVCSLGDAGVAFVETGTKARESFEKIVDNLLKVISDQDNGKSSSSRLS